LKDLCPCNYYVPDAIKKFTRLIEVVFEAEMQQNNCVAVLGERYVLKHELMHACAYYNYDYDYTVFIIMQSNDTRVRYRRA